MSANATARKVTTKRQARNFIRDNIRHFPRFSHCFFGTTDTAFKSRLNNSPNALRSPGWACTANLFQTGSSLIANFHVLLTRHASPAIRLIGSKKKARHASPTARLGTLPPLPKLFYPKADNLISVRFTRPRVHATRGADGGVCRPRNNQASGLAVLQTSRT